MRSIIFIRWFCAIILVSFSITVFAKAENLVTGNPEAVAGCASICASLSSKASRTNYGAKFIEREILVDIAKSNGKAAKVRTKAQLVEDSAYLIELGGKLGGDALSSRTGGRGKALGTILSETGRFARYKLDKYAEDLVASAEADLSKNILLHLNDRLEGTLYDQQGSPNIENIRNIKESDLDWVFSQKLKEEVKDKDLLILMRQDVTIASLSAIANETGSIKEDTQVIRERSKISLQLLSEIKRTQNDVLSNVRLNQGLLGTIGGEVKDIRAVSIELAKNLPPEQILKLHKTVGLGKDVDVLKLQKSIESKKILKNSERLSTTFKSAATAMGIFDFDPKIIETTNLFATVFDGGGKFAAAATLGDPISMFSTGVNLFASISSFGRSRVSAETKLLKKVLEQIAELQKQIVEMHKREIEALTEISSQIADLENFTSRRFQAVFLETAFLQDNVQDLLLDDVVSCERLYNEFKLEENLDLLGSGFLGFSIFFQSDGRASEFSRCMNGLLRRQFTDGETQFASMLRADGSNNSQSDFADGQRNNVRRLELLQLRPSVKFAQEYSQFTSGVERKEFLYRPHISLCEVFVSEADNLANYCEQKGKESSWPETRFSLSQFNPGNGVLLSAKTASQLAQYSRTIAVWNTILREETGRATSRVISQNEARNLDNKTASRRTLHLAILNRSLDVLDLNIAQAQIISGLPSITRAAKLLDEKVIPHFLQARHYGKTEKLDKLLKYDSRENTILKADQSQAEASCISGNYAWDVLCLMENNTTFAKNVIKVLTFMRIKSENKDWEAWRRAIRSPFSTNLHSIIGTDLIIRDINQNFPNRTWGAWAIALPRVQANPEIRDGQEASSCWQPGALPSPKSQPNFYSTRSSERCYELDSFLDVDFERLEHPVNLSELVIERFLVAETLREFCEQNSHYPATYCSRF